MVRLVCLPGGTRDVIIGDPVSYLDDFLHTLSPDDIYPVFRDVFDDLEDIKADCEYQTKEFEMAKDEWLNHLREARDIFEDIIRYSADPKKKKADIGKRAKEGYSFLDSLI